jgi:hypothetical protein
MAAHYWLFPWFSLFVALAAVIGGIALVWRSPSSNTALPVPISYVIVWISLTVLLFFGGLQVGNWGATDYIPARGVVAGALIGWLLAFCIRHKTASTVSGITVLVSLATALLSVARLWLSHGEVSGLVAVGLSSGVSIICLAVAPAYNNNDRVRLSNSSFVLSYLVILSISVLLGFARATVMGDVYWADIPLLIGASFSAGALIAAAVDKFGMIARSAAMIAAFALTIIPVGLTVAHCPPVIGLTFLGALVIALPTVVLPKASRQGLPLYLGFLLIIAAVTLSFTLLSGYGLALLALGSLLVPLIASTQQSISKLPPTNWTSFLALLLLYRLEILQNGDSVRAIGMADLWDLLAIGLGILLPRLVESSLPPPSETKDILRWPSLLQWLLAIAVPSLLLDYIWQPRSLTGLFLGLAIGQLNVSSADAECRDDLLAITSLVSGLLLFVFLPGLDIITAPTRSIRIACVLAVALFVVVRILLPTKRTASTGAN